MIRVCVVCEKPLAEDARADITTCSGRCRMRQLRARRRGAKIAVTPDLGEGYHAVTDSPRPAPATGASSVSPKYTEEELRIPDDLTIPKFLRREPDAPHWKDYD
jgi:hypothetical protein